jgi:putative ABC transport system permease protein
MFPGGVIMKLLPLSYATRNLGRTPGRMCLTIGGSMLVVLLVLAAGGFVTGMRQALVTSGSENNTILLGVGSEESLERSEIPMRTAGILGASLDGILNHAGVEGISPEIHLAMPVSLDEATDERGDGELMLVRGITHSAWLVHDEAMLLAGRVGENGRDEAVLGRLAARALGFEPAEMAIDQSIWIDGRAIKIVGILAGSGGVIEGEIWYPLTDLQVLSQRDAVSCVIASRDGATPTDLAAFASRRLDLELTAIEETDYFASLSAFYAPIRTMVLLTALLVGVGAVIGGLNSNYATFVSRIREMGTLQTLGFSRFAITISLLQESILASAVGALVACFIAIFVLDGTAIRFSMGVFGLRIDATVLAGGLMAGLLLGIAGALLPAWRCLSRPIPEALKTTV